MDTEHEYAALKSEQLERIKLRDNFLNLNLVALATVGVVAIQGSSKSCLWLLVPWICAVLGWAYLSNDDKVSAIAIQLRHSSTDGRALGLWEAGEKGLIRQPWRMGGEVAAFLLTFTIP